MSLDGSHHPSILHSYLIHLSQHNFVFFYFYQSRTTFSRIHGTGKKNVYRAATGKPLNILSDQSQLRATLLWGQLMHDAEKDTYKY